MFYSHEVLTSRKYGVATVWLVATLGSKSTLKKVNRKAILDVNLPKACQTIVTPETPMALRLQSNLLYGVSRVHDQQCGYVLADAQHAHNTMRAMLRVVRSAQLDPEAGKARPDQLLLEDDPAFIPDIGLVPFSDFDLLDLERAAAEGSQDFVSLSARSSQLDTQQLQLGGLGGGFPGTSDTGSFGDVGGFIVPGDDERGSRPGGPSILLPQDEEEGFLPDVGFSFDEEGNMVDAPTGTEAQRAGPSSEPRPGFGSDTAAGAQVGREHEEGQRMRGDVGGPRDLDFQHIDDFALPEGEAFPLPGSDEARRAVVAEEEEPTSEETAAAPMRHKPRALKIIPLDTATELRNSDLARWHTDYLANMQELGKAKMAHRLTTLAKQNAEFWTLGRGIANIGAMGGHPLADRLAGDGLFELITGIPPPVAGQKHARDSGVEMTEDEGARRVRQRPDDEHARGFEDDGLGIFMGNEGVELARSAPDPLPEDISSMMPWNITASIRGSSITRGVRTPSVLGQRLGPGFPSTGGPSSFAGPLGSVGGPLPGERRSSRMVSASPLQRHGLGDIGSGGLGEGLGLDDPTGADVEMHDVAAGDDTQAAGESQWARGALDKESVNFLSFVETTLALKAAAAEDAEVVEEVSFEELLPNTNTRIVAAHGLLHTLNLATKGMITVKQEEHLGDIWMMVVAPVA